MSSVGLHNVTTVFLRFLSVMQGKPIDFTGVDESTARWVQDFNVKPYATPAKLESIDGENAPLDGFVCAAALAGSVGSVKP